MPELHWEAAVGIVLNVHHLSVVGQDEKLTTSEGIQTDELHALCHTQTPTMIVVVFMVCVSRQFMLLNVYDYFWFARQSSVLNFGVGRNMFYFRGRMKLQCGHTHTLPGGRSLETHTHTHKLTERTWLLQYRGPDRLNGAPCKQDKTLTCQMLFSLSADNPLLGVLQEACKKKTTRNTHVKVGQSNRKLRWGRCQETGQGTWLWWWIVLRSWWSGVSVGVWACTAASPPQMNWKQTTPRMHYTVFFQHAITWQLRSSPEQIGSLFWSLTSCV